MIDHETGMKYPDAKLHQYISFVKSGVRIAASLVAMGLAFVEPVTALVLLAGGYGIAELIGIYEELV